MYVTAVISPPLGTSTVVEGKPIRFVASLEVADGSTHPWVVELWYGYNSCLFTGAAFTPASATELTVYDASKQRGHEKRIYTLTLPFVGNLTPFKFTLRFRPDLDSPWIWIRDQTHVEDGQIIFRKSAAAASVRFDTIFSEPDSSLSVNSIDSQVPGVDMFEVSSPAPAQNGVWSDTSIGTPLLLEHFYALVKLGSPWMGPRQGSKSFELDADALIAGYLRLDGRHVVILAVSGLGDTTTYIRSSGGRVLLKSQNDGGEAQVRHAFVAIGPEWQGTVDAAFYAARDLLSQLGITEANAPPELEPLWRESWYDGLGYCTWNSLGRELTETRILGALQSLQDKGIFISTVIIDDNWQSLDDNRRWDKFEANENFPNGLKGLVSEIRTRFPNIVHVAVWHAIIGYWEGIAPSGWIASNYKCTTIKWHGGWDVTVVDETDVGRLYSDFYKFLAGCGIDSVKCDVQCSLNEFDNAVDRQRLGHAYQDAFKINGLRYFSGKVIYCMSQVPQIFFHSLLQSSGPTVLLRNSDDFFPDIPNSHPWHLFANAMNNIFTSHLNCLPDWDMFQTTLPEYAGIHAAGRCISGGPIYITDTPGSHSLPLVKMMSAVSIRDPKRFMALRPARFSLPLNPYVAYNSNRLLKLSTVFGSSSMLAVFNVSTSENSELISLSEFQSLDSEKKYVVRQQSTGKVFGPAATATSATLLSLTLPTAGWEFFSAVPVQERGTFSVGVLGLIEQLSGAAGVVNWDARDDGIVTLVAVTVKALGVLGFYISELEGRNISDMFLTIAGQPVPVHTVRKSEQDLAVLEVDIETAWRELGLSAGWSNEAIVRLYLE